MVLGEESTSGLSCPRIFGRDQALPFEKVRGCFLRIDQWFEVQRLALFPWLN